MEYEIVILKRTIAVTEVKVEADSLKRAVTEAESKAQNYKYREESVDYDVESCQIKAA